MRKFMDGDSVHRPFSVVPRLTHLAFWLVAGCLSADAAKAAITLVTFPFVSQTVGSGATVAVSPSDQIQILVNGVVINPTTVYAVLTPPHVTITLPDSQVFTLMGFVDLAGSAGGGLLDASGQIAVASTIDGLSGTPAATPCD